MQEKTFIRLSDEDWGILLPGEEYPLGKTKLIITPLGLEDLKEAVTRIRSMQAEFVEQGITEDNFQEPTKITFVIEKALEKAPDLIAESSGVHVDDIKRLPPAHAIALTRKVLEVNIESQGDLSKNLEALVETISTITTGTKITNEEDLSGDLETSASS